MCDCFPCSVSVPRPVFAVRASAIKFNLMQAPTTQRPSQPSQQNPQKADVRKKSEFFFFAQPTERTKTKLPATHKALHSCGLEKLNHKCGRDGSGYNSMKGGYKSTANPSPEVRLGGRHGAYGRRACGNDITCNKNVERLPSAKDPEVTDVETHAQRQSISAWPRNNSVPV